MQKQIVHMKSEDLLKYFLESDDEIDTLVKCRGTEFTITTTDHELYEALGSIKEYDNFRMNRLIKLLEVTAIVPAGRGGEKKILTHERVEELRKSALKN